MQIILLEKLPKLGSLGDIVKVKDGFARNFLIPFGKARRATPVNIKAFEVKRAELEKEQLEKLQAAQALAGKMEGTKVSIGAKAGVDGRLFGSITNFDVSEALTKAGFAINKTQIRMPLGAIKTISENEIDVSLHTDVVVKVIVSVVNEA